MTWRKFKFLRSLRALRMKKKTTKIRGKTPNSNPFPYWPKENIGEKKFWKIIKIVIIFTNCWRRSPSKRRTVWRTILFFTKSTNKTNISTKKDKNFWSKKDKVNSKKRVIVTIKQTQTTLKSQTTLNISKKSLFNFLTRAWQISSKISSQITVKLNHCNKI